MSNNLVAYVTSFTKYFTKSLNMPDAPIGQNRHSLYIYGIYPVFKVSLPRLNARKSSNISTI